MNSELDPLALLILNSVSSAIRWTGIVITLWLTLFYTDGWVMALIGVLAK
jgi:hypothetical protein